MTSEMRTINAPMASDEILAGGAARLAHDFNNLLAVIDLSARAIARMNAEPAVAAKLDAINAAVQRGVDLSASLAAIAGRQLLKPEVVDANSVVQGMLPQLAGSLGPGIGLAFDANPQAGLLRIDRHALAKAVTSLAATIAKAMPGAGAIRLSIDRSVHGNLPGPCIAINVDGGSAVPASPPHPTAAIDRSGLELAIAAGFARQSGGWLQFADQPGGGRAARLILPAQA